MAQSQESIITTNWKRTQPSSHFGTRNLQWYYFSVDYNLYSDNIDDFDGNLATGQLAAAYTNPNSLYSAVVKEIQEVAGAELYYLGAPTGQQPTEFVFAVADDDGQGSTGQSFVILNQIGNAIFDNLLGPGPWGIVPLFDEGEGLYTP
jgi:hypothetical protein